MTYDVGKLPMTLRMPGARRLVEHQRQQLKMFDKLESSMENLWGYCESARVSALGKRRRIPIDGERLQQIVEACELGTLAQIPEENRIQMWGEAADKTNGYIANWLEELGDFAVFAHAEIGLRVLIHLAVKSTGHAYEPEMRVPAWNRAIRAAESRAAMIVDAWQTFVEAKHRHDG